MISYHVIPGDYCPSCLQGTDGWEKMQVFTRKTKKVCSSLIGSCHVAGEKGWCKGTDQTGGKQKGKKKMEIK